MAGKNESPKDKGRRVFAELELAFSTAGAKVSRGRHPLGSLSALLEPIAILRLIGTPGKIAGQIESVKAAATINRDLPGQPTEEREANAERFNILEARLLRYSRAAKKAEDELASSGWKFDQEENIAKAKISKGQPGNRPQHFLLRCFEAAADTLPHLQGQALRDAIAEKLWLYFPESELDTAPHGKMDNCLGNYRRK